MKITSEIEKIWNEYQSNFSNEQQEVDRKLFEEKGLDAIHGCFKDYIVDKYRVEHKEPTNMHEIFRLAWIDTIKHANGIFKTVEHHKKSTFPYPTNYSMSGKDIYLVCKGVRRVP